MFETIAIELCPDCVQFVANGELPECDTWNGPECSDLHWSDSGFPCKGTCGGGVARGGRSLPDAIDVQWDGDGRPWDLIAGALCNCDGEGDGDHAPAVKRCARAQAERLSSLARICAWRLRVSG